MNILVVFDSVYGNTAKVAKEIVNALSKKHQVSAVQADKLDAADLKKAEAIFFGSPTRGFQPTPAIKSVVSGLDSATAKRISFALFDTRMDVKEIDNKVLTFLEKRFGYAVDTMKKVIARKGGTVIGQDGFIVEGNEGPLREGELKRAADWAVKIVS